ncbi:hypothetical protein [Kitasatospora aureofaciens]|uniref:hypothetical protein n=1 Tax=Kitasatospora aureofaciens TaxID=1894 RepID=UPI001C48CC0C|nr:hypothetical protein [Kitasatospora aureofaciens]MBV6698836.1 hypothetical protein [Kitasatospora aureofaciens]
MPASPPRAEILCHYQVGQARVDIELMAVPQSGYGVNMLLPRIRAAALLDTQQLQQFAAEQPGPGQTKLVPGQGTAAIARITPKGEGDLVLFLSQNLRAADPEPSLTGEPLRRAAETLAGQLR